MAKPEWGIKRTCESCGERYYDLNRRPAVCPHCGAKGATESAAPVRRVAPVEPVKPKAVVVEVEADKKVAAFDESDADDAEDIDAVKNEDDLIEDASDLGEDDDDIAEAMEHVDNGEVTDGN